MTDNRPYPALITARLTPSYDYFARLFLREKTVKRGLIASAHLAPGDHVLDLGAGTGTMAIMIKQIHPDTHVTGLDADPAILALALSKTVRAEADIPFEVGSAMALPHPNESFDHVLSTLVFSMLSSKEKQRTVNEVYRVLRSGGKLLIADFGPPRTWWGRLLAPRMRRFEPIADNLDGQLPVILREAGFQHIDEAALFATSLGTISLLHGQKP